jgi:DNA-binding NtrC family response regulator
MGQSKPFSRPTVIVVDGDMDERSLLSTLFEASDLTVIECASAEAAFAAMHEKSNDVAMVLTELSLAGRLDGVDLAHLIGRDYPHVRVLVVCGKPAKRLRGLPGNARLLQKPLLALDLLKEAQRIHTAGNP